MLCILCSWCYVLFIYVDNEGYEYDVEYTHLGPGAHQDSKVCKVATLADTDGTVCADQRTSSRVPSISGMKGKWIIFSYNSERDKNYITKKQSNEKSVYYKSKLKFYLLKTLSILRVN